MRLPPKADPLGQAELRSPPLFRWTHGLFARIAQSVDAAALVAASLILQHVDPSWSHRTVGQQLLLSGLKASLFVIFADRLRCYRLEAYRSPVAQGVLLLAPLVGACFLSIMVVALADPAFTPDGPALLSALGCATGGLVAGRLALLPLLRWVERERLLVKNVVVVGPRARAEAMLRHFRSPSVAPGHTVIGVVLTDGSSSVRQAEGRVLLLGVEAIREFALTQPIDVVVLALPWAEADEVWRHLGLVEALPADVVVPIDDGRLQPEDARLTRLAGLASLQLAARPLRGTQVLCKMVEDYAIASVALLLLSPVLLLAAVAVKLDSPGPVLFRQWRPGLGGKPFAILKFRTMHLDPTDDGTVGTRRRDDPRITRVGRFLRRTSIDELPQLINVLRGEMSIVGPRPYVADMLVGDARFAELAQRFATRYRMKPGLTGWAQANGLRSAALRVPDAALRSVEMDLEYIRSWSLWLDLKIIFRTAVFGLRGSHVF